MTRPAPKASDKDLAENAHKYRDPRTGDLLISVTRVVGSYDDGDKLGAGAGAAVKLTKEGKNYREVWNAKRDLGSRVHKHAADWAQGKTVDVLDTDGPYLDAILAFCQSVRPEWIAVERAVVSSLGYGGRFDAVAEIGGVSTLLDFKTGRAWLLELSMQLSAYRFADGMVVYNAEGKAVMVEPMPHVERCAGLYLDETGTAKMVEVDADEAAFGAFCHQLSVVQWANATKARKP